jgi:hypothetical protein
VPLRDVAHQPESLRAMPGGIGYAASRCNRASTELDMIVHKTAEWPSNHRAAAVGAMSQDLLNG